MSSMSSSPSSPSSSSPATADLCDAYVESPSRLNVVGSDPFFRDYGGIKSFSGRIVTVRCFESNPSIRKALEQEGEEDGGGGSRRVLVVDGGGSRRVAILGDGLADMARRNGWNGIIVNGCIRDSEAISKIPLGVKAIGTHPLKSTKAHPGERGIPVAFAGIEFVPDHYVYADADGIIVSETELSVE